MLDTPLRRHIDPIMDTIAVRLARLGVGANDVSILGFIIGVFAFFFLIFHFWLIGLFLIFASRVCDGLDGAIARQTQPTDFGGFLDIVLDFAFYGLIPVAFILADPSSNSIAGGILLLSFYINGSSFLTYALMCEKRDIDPEAYGKKSFFYSTGLTEASETLIAFTLFCLFPSWFSILACLFSLMVFYTTVIRILMARQSFGSDSP